MLIGPTSTTIEEFVLQEPSFLQHTTTSYRSIVWPLSSSSFPSLSLFDRPLDAILFLSRPSSDRLRQACEHLPPGGYCLYSTPNEEMDDVKNTIFMDFLLAGFLPAERMAFDMDEKNASTTTTLSLSQGVLYMARKPEEDLQHTTPVCPSSIWQVNMNEEENELVEEDSLLDLSAPLPTADVRDDCEMDKKQSRKPCKDCTCGRAEGIVEEAQATTAAVAASSSACGNCHKGDAFRCGGCPYLGQPAFTPGSVVQLDLQQDA